jgi:hypothetical protein
VQASTHHATSIWKSPWDDWGEESRRFLLRTTSGAQGEDGGRRVCALACFGFHFSLLVASSPQLLAIAPRAPESPSRRLAVVDMALQGVHSCLVLYLTTAPTALVLKRQVERETLRNALHLEIGTTIARSLHLYHIDQGGSPVVYQRKIENGCCRRATPLVTVGAPLDE